MWGNSQWPGKHRTEEAPAHSLPWLCFSPLLTPSSSWNSNLKLIPGEQNCSLYKGCSHSTRVNELLAIYGVHRSTNHELNTDRERGVGMKCVCSQETTKPVNNRFFGTPGFKSFTGKFNLIIRIIYLFIFIYFIYLFTYLLMLLWTSHPTNLTFFLVTQQNSV